MFTSLKTTQRTRYSRRAVLGLHLALYFENHMVAEGEMGHKKYRTSTPNIEKSADISGQYLD
jgi:hypothetical protein